VKQPKAAMETTLGALREENHRLRESMEQRLLEIAALAERLDQVALASGARDQSWLDELDTVGREFTEERRQLLADLAARDAVVAASTARVAELESQLAEGTKCPAEATTQQDTPLPRWRPKITPFRSSHAA
jgi:BMFP domain-containing protein YqiC